MSNQTLEFALLNHPLLLTYIFEYEVAGIEVRGILDTQFDLLVA
jgi:hypothetical protein